jgi:hypothetical protein
MKFEIDRQGNKYWLNNKDQFHREDGPAVEHYDGTKSWYLNGKHHRLDGPAVEYSNGSKAWWFNGKLHREDGPAIERANGDKEWWINDKLHRLDGPALEIIDEPKEWWIDGRRCSKRNFQNSVIMFLLDCNKESVKLVSELFAHEI